MQQKLKSARQRDVDAALRKLAKQYGRKTVQRWYYDDNPPWVMSLVEWVSTFGTWVGYAPELRRYRAQQFVYGLSRLPSWLARAEA